MNAFDQTCPTAQRVEVPMVALSRPNTCISIMPNAITPKSRRDADHGHRMANGRMAAKIAGTRR